MNNATNPLQNTRPELVSSYPNATGRWLVTASWLGGGEIISAHGDEHEAARTAEHLRISKNKSARRAYSVRPEEAGDLT